MTHYETLGVNKKATKDEIKKAFKKKAMKSHPDRGGSEEEFSELNEAYQVLRVPADRDHYDRTGKAKRAVREEDEFEQYFMGAFNELISLSNEDKASTTDLKAAMGGLLEMALSRDKDDLNKAKNSKKKYQQILKRAKCKGEVNLMAAIANQSLESIKDNISLLEDKIRINKGATKLLKDYEYEFDEIENEEWQSVSFPEGNLNRTSFFN